MTVLTYSASGFARAAAVFADGNPFVSGELSGRAAGAVAATEALCQWTDWPLHIVLLSVCTLSFMLLIRSFVSVFPMIWKGVGSNRVLARIESRFINSRRRNLLAIVALLGLCLISSRYSLYRPYFMMDLRPDICTLITIGLLSGVLLLRGILILLLPHSHISADIYQMSNNLLFNTIILTVVFLLPVVAVFSVFDVDPFLSKMILYGVVALFYIIFISHKIQILAGACSLLSVFLYICVLEGMPACIVILSGILL